MTESSLPTLKPKRGAKSAMAALSSSPTANSSTEMTPAQIKKEVNALYPRLQSVEKEINTLKQQLPSNINKVIIQLRSEIEKITEKNFPENEKLDKEEKTDLQRKIETLESKLQMELDVSIANANTNLEKRITEITVLRPKESQLLSIDLEDDGSFDRRIDFLEDSLKNQKTKTQKRIELIEATLQKYNAMNTVGDDETAKIKTLNDEIDSNRKGIAELRSRLSEMKIKFNKEILANLPASQAENGQGKISAEASQLLALVDIPNLDEPIQNLHNEILSKQLEFMGRVRDLKQRTETCVDRIKKVDQTAVNIVAVTATLESRITEVDNICKNLANVVKDLELSAATDENQNLIHELTEKVIEENAKLLSEIEDVRKRAVQCQESVRKATQQKE